MPNDSGISFAEGVLYLKKCEWGYARMLNLYDKEAEYRKVKELQQDLEGFLGEVSELAGTGTMTGYEADQMLLRARALDMRLEQLSGRLMEGGETAQGQAAAVLSMERESLDRVVLSLKEARAALRQADDESRILLAAALRSLAVRK